MPSVRIYVDREKAKKYRPMELCRTSASSNATSGVDELGGVTFRYDRATDAFYLDVGDPFGRFNLRPELVEVISHVTVVDEFRNPNVFKVEGLYGFKESDIRIVLKVDGNGKFQEVLIAGPTIEDVAAAHHAVRSQNRSLRLEESWEPRKWWRWGKRTA